MIVLLTAILSGSMMGAVLAWTKGLSLLSVALCYVGGGWIGVLVALAFLLLRPEPDDETKGRASVPAGLGGLRRQTR